MRWYQPRFTLRRLILRSITNRVPVSFLGFLPRPGFLPILRSITNRVPVSFPRVPVSFPPTWQVPSRRRRFQVGIND